jgi:nucleoside-diphosphate-sugar epimerase
MRNILITGINGFLGSHLANSLCEKYNIIGLEHAGANKLNRLEVGKYKVYFIKEDIPKDLFQEQYIDIVIHTAAIYGRKGEPAEELIRYNYLFPVSILKMAIANNCKIFINTDTVLDRYVNVYSLTKRHFQECLFYFSNEIRTVNMMLEHFYGPGASSSNFIISMLNRLKKDEPEIELSYGEQRRDFIYIDDVVSAFNCVLERNSEIRNQYIDIHIGTGRLISIKELMIMMKQKTNSLSELKFGALPYRENEMMHSIIDNNIISKFNWTPKFSIEEGIERTLEFE